MKYLQVLAIASLLITLPLLVLASVSDVATGHQLNLTTRRPAVADSVTEIARQVTVRIVTNPGVGAGVIIARHGQTYTVLTCDHVVADSKDDNYQVLTVDGNRHKALRRQSIKFGNVDLALVEFRSNLAYQVATIGDSKTLKVGETVYASGFPNWHWINKLTIENTRTWGFLAFRVTTGNVELLLNKSLPRGYRLGYTNDIENGMSGGPVLNSKGQVIGINGRLKYPFQGIESYIFADGSIPSQAFFEQMTALSWAIPISTVSQQLGAI
ncbi:S1 family peptidase [Synechocystis sp. PCC 7509]|uniref:S1 family peptidase n=1 Tax=Synechocystis sp. PCC 7509 TaxID=927677 RepID=UPI0002AC6A28|nr:serine protease [Synechocystis sp. PCC 7509]